MVSNMCNSKILAGEALTTRIPEDGDGFTISGPNGCIRLIERAHTAVDGETGYGKTNLIFQFFSQAEADIRIHGGHIIIHDPKADFQRRYGLDKNDGINRYILGRNAHWNIFNEILYDLNYNENMGDDEWKNLVLTLWNRARTISLLLFADRLEGQNACNEEFFPRAASDVLTVLLHHYSLNALLCPDLRDELTHEMLFEFALSSTVAVFCESVSSSPISNMYRSTLDKVGNGSEEAVGIWSELTTQLQTLFSTTWIETPGKSISLTELVRERDTQAVELFIPNDFSKSASNSPMNRAMMDFMFQESLATDNISRKTREYFFLDELPLLCNPPLLKISNILNFGLGFNVRLIAAWQGIAQFYALMGKEKADSMLGGFTQNIYFKCTPESAERASKIFGKVLKSDYMTDDRGIPRQQSPRVADAVEAWDSSNLGIGDIIVGRSDNRAPIKFHFSKTE